MKMAIRLNEFAEGLDDEITILDLKPRITTEVIEKPPVGRQGDSLYQNFLDPIDAWGRRILRADVFGDY
jgi:hypothetical protein